MFINKHTSPNPFAAFGSLVLQAGEVDLETDDYGSNGKFISSSGKVDNIANSASDILGTSGSNNLSWDAGTEGDCGASKKKKRSGRKWKKRSSNKSNVHKEKKRPLLKGAKMIDKRTKIGKATMAARENLSARELAARAALARFGTSASSANAASSAAATAATAATNESEDEANSYHNNKKGDDISSSSDTEDDDDDSVDEVIKDHNTGCGCRTCNWTKMFNLD